ncbi:LysM peptidoglycan-binding domain-containing protein [Flavobacteriales bacterium AH-315-E23]|nr:LysM peptidoglycan-binding domain-containing protein [Flavobacteriales bacterium AH-315-E23]
MHIKTAITSFLLALLIGATHFAVCQPDNAPKDVIKVIEGKKYYIHKVQKGETLYGISNRYGVVIKEIVFENPLTINGLKVGETLRIGVPIIVVDPMVLDGKYIYHSIQPGETYYSLSRQYDISIETIDLANPEIVGTLKAGATIRIPVLRKGSSKSSLLEEVLGSMDSTQGALLPDSNLMDSALISVRDSILLKDTYQIALMLPLYLDKNDSLRAKRLKDAPVKIYQKSVIGLEFYKGAMLALDSLRGQGHKAAVTIYDTERDTSKIKEFMRDPTLPYTDLLIGPLYRPSLKIIWQYAVENKIHMVSPFISTNKILIGNEYISKVKPAVQTSVAEIARYIASEFLADNAIKIETNNVILIHNGDPGEIMLCELFKQKSAQLLEAEDDSTEHVNMREIRVVNYFDGKIQAVEDALSVADSNILVILSRDQIFVSIIMAKLHRKYEDYSMVVFGLPVWQHFDNLEAKKLLDLNVHLASADYVDYESESVKKFVSSFYQKYHVYPSKYAFEGFDVTYYYLKVLKEYGYRFSSYLPEAKLNSLRAGSCYAKIGVGSGYENKRVFILKYEDYDLVLKSSSGGN